MHYAVMTTGKYIILNHTPKPLKQCFLFFLEREDILAPLNLLASFAVLRFGVFFFYKRKTKRYNSQNA